MGRVARAFARKVLLECTSEDVDLQRLNQLVLGNADGGANAYADAYAD